MAVSLTVLASGSRGNASVVASSRTRILVDAGISARETFKRMRAVGADPQSLSAILVTRLQIVSWLHRFRPKAIPL